MDREVTEMLTALGALAETCGFLKTRLMLNGFTKKEAMELVGQYLTATVTPRNNKEDN